MKNKLRIIAYVLMALSLMLMILVVIPSQTEIDATSIDEYGTIIIGLLRFGFISIMLMLTGIIALVLSNR